MSFFTEVEKKIPKFLQNCKRPWKTKTILSKKKNVGGITVPDREMYYRV